MKRKSALILSGMLFLTLTLGGCASDSTTSRVSSRTTTARTTTVFTTPAPVVTTPPTENETYNLQIGSVLAKTDPIITGLQQFADKVGERTNGAVVVEVFADSEIGDTMELIEKSKAGENVGTVLDTGVLSTYVPDMAIYTAPYVFDSVREARKFIDTDIFADWDAQLAEAGLRDLSFNFYQGARHFLTNVKVETPSDLEGLRIRTMGSDVAKNSMSAFGAVPVSLAWGDVHDGLISNEEIDAAEGQITAVYGANLHEVVSYIAESGHFLLYTGLVISESWFSELPDDFKTILLEEARSAGDYATELTLDMEIQYKAEMEASGVTFVPVDIEPFKEASASVYDTMGWQELKTKIDAAIGN